MTIAGWILFSLISLFLLIFAIGGAVLFKKIALRIAVPVACIIVIVCILFGMMWYFENTASGRRAMVDQKSDMGNGLERIVRVYTADGNIIAEFEGRIDLEGNDGGYILFDYQGKRYTYYNCFVESIAEIG